MENKVVNKLNEEHKNSMIDEFFDDERPIKSISPSNENLSIESRNNLQNDDDVSYFIKKKRINLTKPSKYNEFLKMKKEKHPKKLNLTKRLNTEYKKDFEQKNNMSDYSLEIKSIEDEDNDNEFYGLKKEKKTKGGFINSKQAKDKIKNFKGFLCDICKNVFYF